MCISFNWISLLTGSLCAWQRSEATDNEMNWVWSMCACACVCFAHMCAGTSCVPCGHWTTQNPRSLLAQFVWSLNWEGQQPLCDGLFLERPDHSHTTSFHPGPLTREARQELRLSWSEGGRPHCLRRYFRNVNGMPEWRASEPRAQGWELFCGHLLRPSKSHSNSFSRMAPPFFN